MVAIIERVVPCVGVKASDFCVALSAPSAKVPPPTL